MRRRARVGFSAHLAELVGRVQRHAGRASAADPATLTRLAGQARVETARRSLRLDASPVTDETADAVERGEMATQAVAQGVGDGPGGAPATEDHPPHPGGHPPHPGVGGWAVALGLEGLGTQEVAAIEYAGCLAAVDAEAELARRLFAEPHATLVALHERLTAGLVEPARADRGRTTDQAVHDGAQGQLLFSLPDPEVARARLAALCDWLGRASVSLPTPVLAGVVHECLVEWQPFEGAGGRLGRAAARLVLRARGLDPYGVLVPDRRGSVEPTAYHRQVAASIRRRGDLAPWLAWWLEGVAITARATADRALGVEASPPPRLQRWLAASAPASVTVAEYADAVGCSPEEAAAELDQGQRAGVVRADADTRGLRFRPGAAAELG
jgi:hypothetical protein